MPYPGSEFRAGPVMRPSRPCCKMYDRTIYSFLRSAPATLRTKAAQVGVSTRSFFWQWSRGPRVRRTYRSKVNTWSDFGETALSADPDCRPAHCLVGWDDTVTLNTLVTLVPPAACTAAPVYIVTCGPPRCGFNLILASLWHPFPMRSSARFGLAFMCGPPLPSRWD